MRKRCYAGLPLRRLANTFTENWLSYVDSVSLTNLFSRWEILFTSCKNWCLCCRMEDSAEMNKINRRIENEIQKDRKMEETTIKLLLLGESKLCGYHSIELKEVILSVCVASPIV